TLLLTATLVWLSWQLVRQDEALVEQRVEERRESAADLAAAALQKSLLQAGEQLGALSVTPAPELPGKADDVAKRLGADSVLIICGPGSVEAFPGGRLLFYPVRPPSAPVAGNVFARADSLEFRHGNTRAAAAILQAQAHAGDPAIRAGALMRLARIDRRSGRLREALASYEALAALGPVPVEGLPADLVGRHAILALVENLGERDRLARDASALLRDVQAGRWRLLRAEYGYYVEEARRRLASSGPDAGQKASLARAFAVESLWGTWRAIQQGKEAAEGQRLLWFAGRPVLILWRTASERLAGLALGPDGVNGQWLSGLQPVLAEQGMGIALTDGDGRAVIGRLTGEHRRQSLRPASATSLPWNLHVVTLDVGARHAYFDARRRVLFGALLFITLLILAGTYFVWRVVAREMAITRLQADFVSAVSHELRTPLTALQQFSELLVGGRVASEEDRKKYYEAMAHESRHLGRLVERLLDFGRMEAGTLHHRTEPLDPVALVRDVVAEFERSADVQGHHIELSLDGPMSPVTADRQMLGCVIWNLLDNAVKYSPGCPTIWIGLEQDRATTAIHVRDRGTGVRADEREEIFRKFFRGAAARAGGVRGAGIGLAMTRQIVASYGGRISLESMPGEGSVFTVLLPRAS
ncbi:MAG: HAMP domain-containing sensor histidine kinase, partial [Vicinamibacterales bacterium]